ncbi:ferritin family protein [Candidatus Coxiella mudrowiae]|uniref:Uncharacterized protein n=1 Tax=Candidatus Coxiella mudrowiae TaxID=2054173 RepID=A0ABM5UU66_9COXI|nr:hypothetical protein [Candidatus Coxiella mudrowiae]AKQ33383.1 Uncharacterized protein CleRT_04400 [Candidatus Coxiella mudrowiae]AKQ33470.1 Uncharacterized protein CleRT_05840 [Candidatus Coxiella mudrowiae]
MSSEGYHEPLGGLTSHTRIMDQAIVSLMVLEWIRRNDPGFDKELREYLFTDKPIVDLHSKD